MEPEPRNIEIPLNVLNSKKEKEVRYDESSLYQSWMDLVTLSGNEPDMEYVFNKLVDEMLVQVPAQPKGISSEPDWLYLLSTLRTEKTSRGLSCGWLQTLPTLCNSSKGDGEKSWFRSFLGKSGAASKKLSRRKKLAAFKTSLRQNRLETALQAALKQEKWDTLRSELIHQSQQMRKWGLFSVEGPYRLQARLRLARLKLELDVERLKIQVLKMREEETACLIKANDSFAAGDDVDEAFFASKDELFEGNISIRELNIRRVYFDECCIKAIGKFRQSVVASGLCLSKDPERQLTRLQRKAVAIDLLGQYALLMLQDRVQTANSSMSTLMSSFRTLRLKQRRIQIKFSEQVEDERTREGRLFQRWVEMVKLKTTEKTHPEEVMAFVNYYVQCLKQSWGMRVDTPLEYAFEKAGLPSADAALLQLVQDIVFRRLWHLVFGYNKETNDVKDLIWRQKVLGVRKLPFKQLGVPKEYFPEGFIEEDAEEQTAGVRQQESAEPIEAPSSFPFQCSSWMLSQMGICLTPKSMITCMFQGIELLQTEAQKYSKESSLLGADALFPIFAFSILHADLPYIHQCLQFLKNFSGSDAMGEEVYYMTMMEAAVAFIMKFDVAIELGPKSRINEDNLLDSMPLRSESSGSPLLCKRSNDANAMDGENISATKAMENLGDWIGQHQAMEETIDVLEQEGWMA